MLGSVVQPASVQWLSEITGSNLELVSSDGLYALVLHEDSENAIVVRGFSERPLIMRQIEQLQSEAAIAKRSVS